jgi:predicted transcriptional regulator
MDKTIVGILPQDEIRKRLLEIVSGKRRPEPREPKIWFTSRQSLDAVLIDERHPVGQMLRKMGIK